MKYNGTKLVKIAENNPLICKKAKEGFELTDEQFKVFQDYCVKNYPQATFGPDIPEPEEPAPKKVDTRPSALDVYPEMEKKN